MIVELHEVGGLHQQGQVFKGKNRAWVLDFFFIYTLIFLLVSRESSKYIFTC